MATELLPPGKLSSNGLRYAHKPTGSPFGHTGSDASRTMSCFLCGRHKLRATLHHRRFAGKPHLVCVDGCRG